MPTIQGFAQEKLNVDKREESTVPASIVAAKEFNKTGVIFNALSLLIALLNYPIFIAPRADGRILINIDGRIEIRIARIQGGGREEGIVGRTNSRIIWEHPPRDLKQRGKGKGECDKGRFQARLRDRGCWQL